MNLFDSDKLLHESDQKAPISFQIYSRFKEEEPKMELKSVVDKKLINIQFIPPLLFRFLNDLIT